MSYCLNPICADPQNLSEAEICHHCGAIVRLQAQYRAIHPDRSRRVWQNVFSRQPEAEPSKPRCVIKQFFSAAARLQATQNCVSAFWSARHSA